MQPPLRPRPPTRKPKPPRYPPHPPFQEEKDLSPEQKEIIESRLLLYIEGKGNFSAKIRNFQANFDLKVTGTLDQETWDALFTRPVPIRKASKPMDKLTEIPIFRLPV